MVVFDEYQLGMDFGASMIIEIRRYYTFSGVYYDKPTLTLILVILEVIVQKKFMSKILAQPSVFTNLQALLDFSYTVYSKLPALGYRSKALI